MPGNPHLHQNTESGKTLLSRLRKAAPVCFAILYAVFALVFSGVFRFYFAAMLLYLAAVMYYNFFYLRRRGLYTFWSWLRPLFFFASLAAIYFVLPSAGLRAVFLLLSALLIYFSEKSLHVISEQSVFLQTLFSYFGISLGIFALNFYFLPQTAVILLALLALTYLAGRSSFENVPQSPEKKNFYSALIAFGLTEIAWALMFLPLHFTVLAAIAFCAFYSLWMLSYYRLFNNLSGKKVSFYILFPAIIIAVIFISTPWR